MLATPSPTMTPPATRGTVPWFRLKPTMNSPIATTATETSMLRIVSGTLYRMVWPGIVKPSMAMKCIAQMGAR
jgi:hypothetical protein